MVQVGGVHGMSPTEVSPELNERACARFLDMQHQAKIDKVRGLWDQDVRTTTVSALSLLSLIKHSAIWERR